MVPSYEIPLESAYQLAKDQERYLIEQEQRIAENLDKMSNMQPRGKFMIMEKYLDTKNFSIAKSIKNYVLVVSELERKIGAFNG